MSIRHLTTDNNKNFLALQVKELNLSNQNYIINYDLTTTVNLTNRSGRVEISNVPIILIGTSVTITCTYDGFTTDNIVLITPYLGTPVTRLTNLSQSNYASGQFEVQIQNNSNVNTSEDTYFFTYLIL